MTTPQRTRNVTLERPVVPDPRDPGHTEVDVEDRPSTEHLFAALAREPEHSLRRDRLRDDVVALWAPRARREARRFRNRGVPDEDLDQIAMLGLLKAVHGFDPRHGVGFRSYLLPTVSGEVKRYFRDCTWAVRVPRTLQEHRSEYNHFTLDFSRDNGREPTQTEIAEHFGLDQRAAAEMIRACAAYAALSLDRPGSEGAGGGDTRPLAETMASPGGAFDLVEDRQLILTALRCLGERERRVVVLRFFADKTQSQIAQSIGYSQMHVSRLLTAALSRMREHLADAKA